MISIHVQIITNVNLITLSTAETMYYLHRIIILWLFQTLLFHVPGARRNSLLDLNVLLGAIQTNMKSVKGTVSREKFFNSGLGEMDWTLTIDHTWVLHFPDQLFNCFNILTVCRLEVKPVLMTFSNWCAPLTNWACCCCSQLPNSVRTAAV